MADDHTRILDLIYWVARRRGRRRFLMGTGRVNQSAVAEAMEIHPSILSRFIKGETKSLQPPILEGLKLFADIDSWAELWDQIETTQPAPPEAYLANDK